MRLTRLRLHDVGRHAALDIAFAPGLTVIRGPNEAGKTTIQRAIELALARKVTSVQADLDAIRSWAAGPDGRPVIQLDFIEEDIDSTRHGHLEKAFRGARGTVRLDVNGEITTDPTEVEEQLARLTGIPTEPFFRSTASVRHHELEQLDRDEASLRDRLQASISGADRGTSAARKKLERAIHDLQMRGDRNPGRLKTAEEAVARLTAAVDQGDAALTLLAEDRDALGLASERRREAATALAEGRAMLEKARQAERFLADRDAARERFERFRSALILAREVEQLQLSPPSAHPLPLVRQHVERMRSLDREIAALSASLDGARDMDVQAPVPEPAWRTWANLAVLFAAAAGAGVFGAILAPGINQGLFWAAAVTCVAIAVLAGFVALRRRQSLLDMRAAGLARADRDTRRSQGRAQLESELAAKQAGLASELGFLSLSDIAAAEDLLARQDARTQTIERSKARLEGLAGTLTADELTRQRDAAALEIEQKAAALEALGPIAREPRARERLETDVRDAESALERWRDDEAKARARVEANLVDAEQVAAESEQLAVSRERLAAVQRRARLYKETLEAIERAERTTMRTATRYLERTMVADVERITNGRYRRVSVDDQTLDIRVFAPEKADWVAVSQLSQGTVDQVYLAARLGLVRLVTGDRRPPLIFDDPFVTFDDDRAVRALDLLHDLARDFQVIYLTCSDRYDAVADSVVELPGPSAVDGGEGDEPQPEPGAEREREPVREPERAVGLPQELGQMRLLDDALGVTGTGSEAAMPART